ncbi:MAG: cystathionine beta-lyase [Planctomycetota bacterium]|nr:MAG: cystathionine beta-lyase [Planctomycetota bacterium]
MPRKLRPESQCVHGGGRDASPYHAVVPPIYQSATFRLEQDNRPEATQGKGRHSVIYSRYTNPTLWHLEEQLAALEGAESALALSSGMAALASTVMALSRPGDWVAASKGGYGTTSHWLQHHAAATGREVHLLPNLEVETLDAAGLNGAGLVLAESIGNPLTQVNDLPALAQWARAKEAKLIVDATFASPVLHKPLELGADLVVHSASKYLNGHSDVIAGCVAGSKALIDTVWDFARVQGCCLDPHAAWLLQRGIRSLSLRMERICSNSQRLAEFLERQDEVSSVAYPGLASHPHHARAAALLPKGAGGILSFHLSGGDRRAGLFCRHLQWIQEATSLGGVESLISAPWNTSHAGFETEERQAMGIGPGCLRLAVGIEHVEDLEQDLQQALQASAY